MNNSTTQVSSINHFEDGSKGSFEQHGNSQTPEKDDFGLSSLEIKGVSMKLFTGVAQNEERPWMQKSKVLARVEDQFVNYFL
jgi:hypothetical protein